MSPQSATSANDPAASAHITSSSLLGPTIKAWRYFLEDQGVSPHTVKAFSSDMHLLASYLPPDRAVGDISTSDLNLFLDWLQSGRGVPCSPKSLARRITSIKAFFRWLHQYGALADRPGRKSAPALGDQPAAGGADRTGDPAHPGYGWQTPPGRQTGCPPLALVGCCSIPGSRKANAWRST